MSDITDIVGHRGLDLEEPLLFDQGEDGRCGVDLPSPPDVKPRLGGLQRKKPVGLPGLSEPQVIRHFTRLSRNNFSIDANMYPLGSCTMKHNPRLNERIARLAGFAHIHPLQPQSTVPGALQVIDDLAEWLRKLTGMPGVAMSPGAGAHGELLGMMAIRAAVEDKGEQRSRVLVPESAHGTNPATAKACGFTVDTIPADDKGRVDLQAFKQKLGEDVAGIMLTNPNTCGLFEPEIVEIAEAVHKVGAYFYCDGANFNAIVGRVRPADLGIDAMHINLHKTFSTPHGGGGPGGGPVVLSHRLADYEPLPVMQREGDSRRLVERPAEADAPPKAFGRLKPFHGQMGMFTRALAYIASHGIDGLEALSGDAVLNANYVMTRLSQRLTQSFPGPCMHECLFDERFLKGTGIQTADFAKALIDAGFHAPTIYFPLVVQGALLIEPTESESLENLDEFCEVMLALAERAQSGEHAEAFKAAPTKTYRRRLDEVRAARHPHLRWQPPAETAQAAE